MMEPEPNRESTVDKRDLTNDDFQIADIDESSKYRGEDEEGQKDESLPESDQNSTLVQEGECRICFAPTEASGEDPILELGCRCKNELRYGHESCLTKWFVEQITRHGTSDCELCRSPLGAHLEIIVRDSFEEASQTQGFRPVRLLLQLPREELDRLQVPLETPSFYDLPRETRRALVTSMNRHEQMHLRGETRHSANVIVMAYILAVISAEGPQTVEEMHASIGEAIEIRDRILGGSGELVDLFAEIRDDQHFVDGSVELVDLRPYDEEQDTDTNVDTDHVSDEERIIDLPRNVVLLLHSEDDEPHTVENDEEQEMGRIDGEPGDMDDDDMEFYALWDRHIVEVNAEHLMPSSDELVENELNEIYAHVDFLAANVSGDLLYEILRLPDRSATRTRRDRTYGRYRTFLLRDIP